jgi:mono/diheme cytochrome c family protein
MEEFMLKNLLIIVMAVGSITGVCAGASGRADQPGSKVLVSLRQTTPSSGAQMYTSYCGSCHGVNLKGNGPSATALKTPPADLTFLSRNNGGKFPTAHVKSVLMFGPRIPTHGNLEMPVWGPVLGKMDQANTQETQLRISNLSRYLESFQAK